MPCNHKTSFIFPSKHAREIEKRERKYFSQNVHIILDLFIDFFEHPKLLWSGYMYGGHLKVFFYQTKGVS